MINLTQGSKHLQYRPLTEPLDLSIHLTSKHQSKHLVITQKRPNWVTKRGGNIPFNEEMAVPGQAIPNQRHKEHTPPIETHRVYQAEKTSECTHKMPTPCGWF